MFVGWLAGWFIRVPAVLIVSYLAVRLDSWMFRRMRLFWSLILAAKVYALVLVLDFGSVLPLVILLSCCLGCGFWFPVAVVWSWSFIVCLAVRACSDC